MTLIEQLRELTGALPAAKTAGRRAAGQVMAFTGNSLPARVYGAMSDGEVWTSAKVAARFNVPRASARSALRRLEARGMVHMEGTRPGQGPTPESIYRRG